MKIPFSAFLRPVLHMRRRTLILTFLFGVFIAPGKGIAVTGCLDIIGKTPEDAPGIECPTLPATPCPATHLGPLSNCILLGEDPPSSDPHWDEPISGYVGQGGTLNTTACGPPISAVAFPYRPNAYMLNCPQPMTTVIPLR